MQKYSQRGGGMSGTRALAPCVMGPPLGVQRSVGSGWCQVDRVAVGAKSIAVVVDAVSVGS
jgi:hypothetical protein